MRSALVLTALLVGATACAVNPAGEPIELENGDSKQDGSTSKVVTVREDQSEPIELMVRCNNLFFRCKIGIAVQIVDVTLQKELATFSSEVYDEAPVELAPGDMFGVGTFELRAQGVYWDSEPEGYYEKFTNLIGLENRGGTLVRNVVVESFQLPDQPSDGEVLFSLRPLYRPNAAPIPEAIEYRVSASWH